MKLLYCVWCNDIFNLDMKEKSCACGKIHGKYLANGLDAEWSGGMAVPFMIHSSDFERARIEHNANPTKQIEIPFRACTIPYECKTLSLEKSDKEKC